MVGRRIVCLRGPKVLESQSHGAHHNQRAFERALIPLVYFWLRLWRLRGVWKPRVGEQEVLGKKGGFGWQW